MQLQKVSKEILDQLIFVCNEMEDEKFSLPLNVLSGNTIGKHVRHIIEFFDLVMLGKSCGFVDYDQRSHDKIIENNSQLAVEKMLSLKQEIDSVTNDFAIKLKVNYEADKKAEETIKSSFFRELQYNIEHAIHHMAIIKIAISSCFDSIKLPENFGVAYSTVRYLKEVECAQ